MDRRITIVGTGWSVGVVALVIGAGTLAGCSDQPRPQSAITERPADQAAGQIDREALIIAYYRSERFAKQIDALRVRRNAARAAGDEAAVAECDRQGLALQERAHQQLWGGQSEKPITDDIQDILGAIADRRHLRRIEVVDKPKTTSDGSLIDITPDVLAALPADPRHPATPTPRGR
ncbi:MAG: hypothetical protein JNJ48_06550 [Phycisphaerae bacterium]|nr:hypothetical protein [Phycisphaerae bacterium]